jgi:hypothetical protein
MFSRVYLQERTISKPVWRNNTDLSSQAHPTDISFDKRCRTELSPSASDLDIHGCQKEAEGVITAGGLLGVVCVVYRGPPGWLRPYCPFFQRPFRRRCAVHVPWIRQLRQSSGVPAAGRRRGFLQQLVCYCKTCASFGMSAH